MYAFEMDGFTDERPAQYEVTASFSGGRIDTFWTDDREAALAKHEEYVANILADFVMAFDYQAVREMRLFIAEIDRPVRVPFEEMVNLSDEEIEREILQRKMSDGF